MTAWAGPSELLTGKPSVAVEFLVWLPLARIRDRICGKKTTEGAQIELGNKGWAPPAIAGAQQIALREQCSEVWSE